MRRTLDKVVLVATACTIVASVALPAAWKAFRKAML
jgi:hypothetical protein